MFGGATVTETRFGFTSPDSNGDLRPWSPYLPTRFGSFARYRSTGDGTGEAVDGLFGGRWPAAQVYKATRGSKGCCPVPCPRPSAHMSWLNDHDRSPPRRRHDLVLKTQ